MTTLYGSKKDLTLSIGFFVLVAAAVSASTLIRGSTVLGVVFLVVTIALVMSAIVLHRRPANEMRVSDERIELCRPGRTFGSISRHDSGGAVEVRRHVYQGRAFWSLVPAGVASDAGVSIDDFVPDEVRAAAEQHGWTVDIVE